MIRIIDATLCMLDRYNLTKEQIFTFLSLMNGIGIRELQISIKTYQILEGKLPAEFIYYMDVPTKDYISDAYPKSETIQYYLIPKQSHDRKEIEAYQVNDLEEPIRLKGKQTDQLLYVKGLDRLLIAGCTTGMELLKKRFLLGRLILCPEDTYHCATAIAILFLQNKGYASVTTISGVGSKAATEQVLMAMHVLDRYMVNRDFSHFAVLRSWMEDVLGRKISPMAPILGERIFHVESGVHVDGILKKASNYEPYPPELVGLKREIILGKHSGKSSISYKMQKLFHKECEGEEAGKLLDLVKESTRRKGATLTDEEFIKIAEGYDMNEESVKDR
ncbi:MAG: hypothetical protein ACK5ML_09300 [Lachnospiraceae bacterium]